MWMPFLPQIAERRSVLAPDLLGYGASPPWRGTGRLTLRDEVSPILSGLDGPVDVVAHSYGAAVALRLLFDAPHRVGSLALIEPSCFYLLQDLGPCGRDARRKIRTLTESIREHLGSGQTWEATALFIDYWNGPGFFAAMPDERRSALVKRIGKVICDFDAIAGESICLDMMRKVSTPALIVTGDSGPRAPRLIGDGLVRSMPRGSGLTIAGAGHMLPLTHADVLSGALARWLPAAPCSRSPTRREPTSRKLPLGRQALFGDKLHNVVS